jgi:hypothetical protein
MPRIVALLDSMYGWGGWHESGAESPRCFTINPRNLSGRRLYRMCGSEPFVVTNSCRFIQLSADHHGKPDSKWVYDNLRLLMPYDLLLVCGKIAQSTFRQAASTTYAGQSEGEFTLGNGVAHYICMDHPAARRWTRARLDEMNARIAEVLLK